MLEHEAGSHDPQLGFSKAYWVSRGRATAWAAAYSLQFEFGPLSEASIGSVGMHPGTTGWVDHVVTPAGTLGSLVAEDVVDRYVMTRIESWTGNRKTPPFCGDRFCRGGHGQGAPKSATRTRKPLCRRALMTCAAI